MESHSAIICFKGDRSLILRTISSFSIDASFTAFPTVPPKMTPDVALDQEYGMGIYTYCMQPRIVFLTIAVLPEALPIPALA
jgi:hypothetical protein